MEWLFLTVVGAIVVKLVERTMDALLERRRERQKSPLTQKQIRRRLAVRLLIAAVSCALYALFALVMFAGALAGNNVAAGVIGVVLALGAALFARSARRRWVAIKTSRFIETQIGRP